MDVTIILEGRFIQSADGAVWSASAFPYTFWARYLNVFENVRVAARLGRGEPGPGFVRSDGPRVQFLGVPYFVGPWQYILRRSAVRMAIRKATGHRGALIMRVGSELANLAWPAVIERGQPYAVEVVGDPWDVFAPGVVRHPLRPFLRRYFARRLRKQCAQAAAAAYVTERTLQRRYPLLGGRSAAYSTGGLRGIEKFVDSREFVSSDVSLQPATSRVRLREAGVATVVFVGSLEQLYKGPDILLRALAACVRNGHDLELRVVGDGRFKGKLESLARRLGLGHRVSFLGALPSGEAVFSELSRADLFVLPSRTEGLPRALIEAMAVGLPCIATGVGGIPELLDPEDLVPPGDVGALTTMIESVLRDPDRRARMSQRNLERSKDFREERLAPRRRSFYEYVARCTEAWLAGAGDAR